MIGLVIAGTLTAGLSGLPGLCFGRSSPAGERIATTLLAAGGLCGILGSLLGAGGTVRTSCSWPALDASLSFELDGLAAAFLLPMFLLSAAGSLYGLRYWRQVEHPENGRKLRLFYGLLTAGMATVFLAGNGLTFLLGWEVMTAAAFLTLSTQDEDPEARRAGLLYLLCSHTATLALLGMFGTLRVLTGSWEFAAVAGTQLPTAAATAVFVLALIGFGMKAGVMPLHFWLPSAHATAPSHVSALMSGILIKTGIYGLVRTLSLFPAPPLWWGETLLVLGIVSAVLGVVFALCQHDVKHLLAYHSVENIGIILLGLGVASIGRSAERPALVTLGLAGALLHTWNHALFKALLFLSAGSLVHATGSRQIDRFGGLARRMPFTAAAFLLGAVAICGLPPLNGFVSELLVYLGMFRSLASGAPPAALVVSFATPALALVGGLALACFVKVFGTVFLGAARSERARTAHESAAVMLVPMGLLAACCTAVGLAPLWVAPLLDHAVAGGAPERVLAGVAQVAPLAPIGVASPALLAAVAVVLAVLFARLRAALPSRTWGCAYGAPTPRMQYTASSFADGITRMFRWFVLPTTVRPSIRGAFPAAGTFHSHVPDPMLDRLVLPVFRAIAHTFGILRRLQAGSVPLYLCYILATLFALLALV